MRLLYRFVELLPDQEHSLSGSVREKELIAGDSNRQNALRYLLSEGCWNAPFGNMPLPTALLSIK